jgi:hypothetical protein
MRQFVAMMVDTIRIVDKMNCKLKGRFRVDWPDGALSFTNRPMIAMIPQTPTNQGVKYRPSDANQITNAIGTIILIVSFRK